MKHKDLQITHVPFGNEQPYFQQPFERFPRYPLAGMPISVGAVIDPMDEGEFVELLWRGGGDTTAFKIVPAICIGTSDSVGNSGCDRYWLATIPPQDGGVTIDYYFRVSSGQGKAETETFSFTVGTRVTYDRFIGMSSGVDSISIKAVSQETGDSLIWELRKDDDHISSVITIGEEDPAGEERREDLIAVLPGSFLTVAVEKDLVKLTDGPVEIAISGITSCTYTVGESPYREISFGIAAEKNERFFGFGERYNKLDQRGELIGNRVFEQYKNQRLKTYMPIPFFQTNRGYGLSVDTKRNASFDLCVTDEDQVGINVEMGPDTSIRMNWYFGNPLEIQSAFSKGQLSLLEVPEWAYGPWMSSNEWNSQSRVLSEVKTSNELDIPASVVVIEAWSDEATFYIWNDAEYQPKPADQPMRLDDFTYPEDGLWPDPKGMIDQLHEEGKKLVLWQIPVVKQFNEHPEETPEQQLLDHAYVEEAGLCLREEDGSAYRVRPGWFSHSKVPDLAAKKARDWWFSKRAYLMKEMGVDGFKTDGGEHLWGYTVQASKAYEEEFGKNVYGDEMINSFPIDYISSYHEAMGQHGSDGQALTFSRSGYSGAGGYPCHWTGDQDSTWDAYRGVINAVLNSNISGIPIIGWDIGGFSGEIPTAELYLRSAAAAVFSPIMQYHSEFYNHVEPHVDRTPWNIAKRCEAPEVIDIYRKFAKLRIELIPYIGTEVAHVKETGEPLVRPLWLDTPDDHKSWEIEDSYRFGRALLIAPVLFEGEAHRKVYLPKGTWEDVWTGKQYDGQQSITCDVPLDTIPVFRDLDKPWELPEDTFKKH